MSASTAGWVSSSHAKEVERLTQLLWHYETANIEQKEQLEVMQTSREGLIARIQQMENEKKKLLKQIRNLELSVKFEKSASEGLRKKSGMLEKEKMDLEEAFQRSQQHELDLGQRREALERDLQQERAYRLQLVHEKERLQEEVVSLQDRLSTLEKNNAEANSKLLAAQQRLETVADKNTRQEKLIRLQADEISALNMEVMQLKEDNLKKTRKVLSEQANHSDYHYTIDQMQEEISFLRKELTLRAQGQSERSVASYQPHKTVKSNFTTKKVNSETAKRFTESHFRDQGTFRTRNSQAAGLVLSSAEAPASTSSSSFPGDESPLQQKSWISDQFPTREGLSTSSTSTFGGNPHTAQSSRGSRKSYSPPPLSPSATRDRPRNALSSGQSDARAALTPLNQAVDHELEGYFNSPQRVAMMDWIRTSSRQASRQRLQMEETKRAQSTSAVSHGDERHDTMQARTMSLQDIYAPGSSMLSSSADFAPRRLGPESSLSTMKGSGYLQSSTDFLSSASTTLQPASSSNHPAHAANDNPSKRNHNISSSLAQILEIPTTSPAPHKQDRGPNVIPNARHKSRFVGSGLSLRKNDSLDAELQRLQNQGSTKHMLRRILGPSDTS